MNYQDRGNKKWTAMFLPEHKDRIHEWALSQDDIARPMLSSDQLEELNYAIEEYLPDHYPIIISHYRNKQVCELKGILHSSDLINRVLVVYDHDYNPVRVSLSNIVSIERE